MYTQGHTLGELKCFKIKSFQSSKSTEQQEKKGSGLSAFPLISLMCSCVYMCEQMPGICGCPRRPEEGVGFPRAEN